MVRSLLAGNAPGGELIELHSCEVYAGACTVSSQATLGGRYMLQVWDFTQGSWQGAPLGGLKAAVFYASPGNLAEQGTPARSAVIYLPASAQPAQREALLAWLKSQPPVREAGNVTARVVAVSLDKAGADITFTAGRFASLKTIPLSACAVGGCGEDLWYTPRSRTAVFTVAVDVASQVNEPLLSLKWTDHGSRSVFVGRFGEPAGAENQFVRSENWCGPDGRLF